VHGHEPHPGQHIKTDLTKETRLIMPERPIIQTRGIAMPGIIFTNHPNPSYSYAAVNTLIETSAVIGHVTIQIILITG
jgi:hypothetical protein